MDSNIAAVATVFTVYLSQRHGPNQGYEKLFTGKIALLNGELFILRDDANGV